MNRRRKLSPSVKLKLEQDLAQRISKKKSLNTKELILNAPTKVRKKIVIPKQTKTDIKKDVVSLLKEKKALRTSGKVMNAEETRGYVDKKTQEIINYITADVKESIKEINQSIDSKISQIPKHECKEPKPVKVPTEQDIKNALSPMIEETKSDFQKRINKIHSVIKDQKEQPQKEPVKKIPFFGGGSGANYLFELFDTPKKAKGRNGAYVGYEGKVLQVASDGKSLEFADVVGGTSELLDATLTYSGSQLTTVTTTEGDTNLTYTGTQLTQVTLPNGTIATLVYSGNQLTNVTYS